MTPQVLRRPHGTLHAVPDEHLGLVAPEPPLRALGPVFGERVHRVVTGPARGDVHLPLSCLAIRGFEFGVERRIDPTQGTLEAVRELVHEDVLMTLPRAVP